MSNQKQKTYECRIVATNRRSSYDLCWIKVSNDIYCGLSTRTYRYHASLHKSGEAHLKKQDTRLAPNEEPPAVAQMMDTYRKGSLRQLGEYEDVTHFALPIDDSSLQDWKPFKDKHYHSIIWIDACRFSRRSIGVTIGVSPPHSYLRPKPSPPGFRQIVELPQLWIVVDVYDSVAK